MNGIVQTPRLNGSLSVGGAIASHSKIAGAQSKIEIVHAMQITKAAIFGVHLRRYLTGEVIAIYL